MQYLTQSNTLTALGLSLFLDRCVFQTSTVPHGALYNIPTHRTTIGEYLRSWDEKPNEKSNEKSKDKSNEESKEKSNEESKEESNEESKEESFSARPNRQFLFDGGGLYHRTALSKDVGDPPNVLNFTTGEQGLRTYLHQFSLGPKGSGAQPHFHGTATLTGILNSLNVCMY